MTDAADWYLEFGREVRGASPAYGRLCEAVVNDPALLARLDALPEPKRQPNLLFAAVRLLGGPVEDPLGFLDYVHSRWGDIAGIMRERRTQTNEAGRCAALLPILARLPQPLALLEVGASAGLCLYPDRYGYSYGGVRVGPDDSPVQLECAVEGKLPVPQHMPDVVWRAGLDLNPLDVGVDEDVRWLEALVWPEQEHRQARLLAAAEVARADPPYLVRGDLVTDLPDLAAQAPRDATLVVFHTSVLAYVDAAGRSSFMDTVAALPGHWLSSEAPRLLPFTAAHASDSVENLVALDRAPLAATTPHGDRLRWL
jgi:hypothetical protein